MSRIVSHQVGATEIITLTDGTGQFDADKFPKTAPETITGLLNDAGKSVIETNFNAFLIRSPGHTMLVDTGARELFGPTAGFLDAAMEEAGVTAAEIDQLFITHMHPDHCAGAVSVDGQAIFPNAELLISDVEHAFWSDYSQFSGRGAQAEGAYALSKSVFDAYADRILPVTGHADLGHGIGVVPMPGHTPGHSGLRIEADGNGFLIVGDIVHAVDLQLPDPDIGVVYDRDGDEAAKTRKHVLDMLASDGMACSGGHFLFPAIGHIERAAKGYRFVAES